MRKVSRRGSREAYLGWSPASNSEGGRREKEARRSGGGNLYPELTGYDSLPSHVFSGAKCTRFEVANRPMVTEWWQMEIRALLPLCASQVHVKPFQIWHGGGEQVMQQRHPIVVVVYSQRDNLVSVEHALNVLQGRNWRSHVKLRPDWQRFASVETGDSPEYTTAGKMGSQRWK